MKSLSIGILLLFISSSIASTTTTAAYIEDPGFEASTLSPAWHAVSTQQHPVSRAVDPTNSSNHVMEIQPYDDEDGLDIIGHIFDVVPLQSYNLTFQYMFVSVSDYTDWDNDMYPQTGCNPCTLTLPTQVHFTKKCQPNIWYTWSGIFKAPKKIEGGEMKLEIGPSSSDFQGVSYIDNFTFLPVTN